MKKQSCPPLRFLKNSKLSTLTSQEKKNNHQTTHYLVKLSVILTMDSGKVMLVPVGSDDNVATLRKFRNVLQTALGPNGAYKLLVTGGGYLQLSSTSSTLISRLDLQNPICRYIGQVSAGLPDYGLYFGVLVSHLMEQQWGSETLQKQKLQNTLGYITGTMQEFLSSEMICRKVDFNSISCFIPLVKTVLSSKCIEMFSDFDLEKVCVEVVKVFLNCVNDESNSIGRVYVKAECGPNHISSHKGLLYQITEDYHLNIIKAIDNCIVKVLIFTIKLESTDENSISTHKIIEILEKAIDLGVNVVACQKTVCDEIKLYLRRRKVLLLERMGTDFTTELLHLSKAFPISQLDIPSTLDQTTLFGDLSSTHYVEFNQNDYVLLQNDCASTGTLLIESRNLTGSENLKVLIHQAISALKSLAVHPFLTPGGGCLEIWLIAQLNHLKEKAKDREPITVSTWIQRALLSTCGTTPPYAMDSVYNHGWSGEEDSTCRCGLVTRKQLLENSGQLIFVSELINSWSGLKLSSAVHFSEPFSFDTLVDSHLQKQNVILSALEVFNNLSDIGLIIYKE